MVISFYGPAAVPESLQEVSRKILELLHTFTEKEINTVPFEGSWTAAQVADHMTLSNTAMARAMELEGKTASRRPDERVANLEEVFLDFNSKLDSPDFILPTRQIYEPAVITGLERSYALLQERASATDLSGSIDHPIFGDITKLELIYFVIFHTQRHTHQLQKIRNLIP